MTAGFGMLKNDFFHEYFHVSHGREDIAGKHQPPLPKTRSPGPCGTADVTVESSNFMFESLEKKVGKEMEQMKQQIRQLESPKEQER